LYFSLLKPYKKGVEKKFDNVNEEKFLRNYKEFISEINKLFKIGKAPEFIE